MMDNIDFHVTPKHSENGGMKMRRSSFLFPINMRFIRSWSSRLLTLMLVLWLSFSAPIAFALDLSNGQPASLVLGQPGFTTGVSGTGQTGMNWPMGVTVDPATGKVFVADTSNNRVLRFADLNALSNGASAEAVFGQPDFNTITPGTSQAKLFSPSSTFMDSAGRLWVADGDNNRVLRFDSAATKGNGANADGVLGQVNFNSGSPGLSDAAMTSPMGVTGDGSGTL